MHQSEGFSVKLPETNKTIFSFSHLLQKSKMFALHIHDSGMEATEVLWHFSVVEFVKLD